MDKIVAIGYDKNQSRDVMEFFDIVKETPDDKIMISEKDELVLRIRMGKKLKEFVLGLEKAEISNEESLEKRVGDLQKQLERKTFEASFYKEQYEFILKHLQLRPNIE